MSEASNLPAPRTLEGWLSPARFAVLLALLVLAAFPQVLLGLQTFVVRDFGFFAYPAAFFQRECFWNGEVSLWNPYNNCGVPFLAQWNTMPLYPPSLIYLVLPLTWSLSAFCLAHLHWAGLGMYFLAYRWTGNRTAAAAAGVIFAFNGFTLNLLMWPSHIATFSWMPWVVWLTVKGWREGGRALVIAALAGALQMLAGGPETILMTWVFLLLLLGADLAGFFGTLLSRGKQPTPAAGSVARPASRALLYVVRFGLIVLVVTLLASAQLIPFLDLAAHSQREQGFADARWSMPGWGWANFFVPLAFGRIWNMGVFFQYEQSWTSSYYMGIGTLLLVILATGWTRGRQVKLLTCVAAVSLLLAMGDQTFIGRWLREAFPQLTLITYPVKFVTWFVLVSPLLAACALAEWLGPPSAAKKRAQARLPIVSAAMLLMIAGIVFWAWKWPFATDDFSLTVTSGITRGLFLLAIAGLLLLLAKPHRRWAALAPFGLLLFLWADAYTHGPRQNPGVETWIYDPDLVRQKLKLQPQPELGTSRVLVSPTAEVRFTQFIMRNPRDNFLVKRLALFANCNLLDRVPKVNGFFSLYPRECGEVNSTLYGSTNVAYPRLAEFMAVSHVSHPEKVDQWMPFPNRMPMITAGQAPVFLDDTNGFNAIFDPGFDFRRSVVLPPEARQSISATNAGAGVILGPRFENARVTFKTESRQPSLCVVAQTWSHHWRAFIDGQPATLWRANYAFQAIEVPAGRHEVRFEYQDRGFQAGIILSGLSLCACGAFLWWSYRRGNPASKGSVPAATDGLAPAAGSK